MNPSVDKSKKNNPDEFTNRLIKLPNFIWQVLDDDAHRSRRSSTKQVEAILASYYEIDDVNLNINRVKEARKSISPKTRKSDEE